LKVLNIKRLQMRTDTKIRVIRNSISCKTKDIEMVTEAIHHAIVERKDTRSRDKLTPKFEVFNAYAGHFIGKGGLSNSCGLVRAAGRDRAGFH
jgi:hypothetical protein